MLDILAAAKKVLPKEALYEVEAAIEYALADIAEDFYTRNKTTWREAYSYAASIISPEEGGSFVIKRLKQEYPPILEVSAQANITKASLNHFRKLASVKGPQPVITALINLKRKREPEFNDWCDNIMEALVHDFSNMGPGGTCKCVKCGKEIPHIADVPCTMVPCPDCGDTMLRKEIFEEDISDNGAPDDTIENVESCVCPSCSYSMASVEGTCGECPFCSGIIMKPSPAVSEVGTDDAKTNS